MFQVEKFLKREETLPTLSTQTKVLVCKGYYGMVAIPQSLSATIPATLYDPYITYYTVHLLYDVWVYIPR